MKMVPYFLTIKVYFGLNTYRVGNHIQNIAEELIFFMEAKVLKHKKKNKPKD